MTPCLHLLLATNCSVCLRPDVQPSRTTALAADQRAIRPSSVGYRSSLTPRRKQTTNRRTRAKCLQWRHESMTTGEQCGAEYALVVGCRPTFSTTPSIQICQYKLLSGKFCGCAFASVAERVEALALLGIPHRAVGRGFNPR